MKRYVSDEQMLEIVIKSIEIPIVANISKNHIATVCILCFQKDKQSIHNLITSYFPAGTAFEYSIVTEDMKYTRETLIKYKERGENG